MGSQSSGFKAQQKQLCLINKLVLKKGTKILRLKKEIKEWRNPEFSFPPWSQNLFSFPGQCLRGYLSLWHQGEQLTQLIWHTTVFPTSLHPAWDTLLGHRYVFSTAAIPRHVERSGGKWLSPHFQTNMPRIFSNGILEAVGAVRSKATTCEAFPSNRSVGKRPRAVEHGRSLNGCKPQSLSGYKAPARGMKALLQCLRENNKGVLIPAGPTCLHRFLGWWIWW